MLSWPFTWYKQVVRSGLQFLENVSENMGTGFSYLEVLQEPEVREDQLK